MSEIDVNAIASALRPEQWRCSMCGGLNTTLVIVPKRHNVHFLPGDDGSAVPLLVKLHPGKCQEAWERYGKPDDETVVNSAIAPAS